MRTVVTGAAGFIGYHVTKTLLAHGEPVIGIDNLNDYYDVELKHARLERLRQQRHFLFVPADITDASALDAISQANPEIEQVIHLAAQAGVRYSLQAPMAYIHSNVAGQTQILEWCRRLPKFRHLTYASSSSVYGANTKVPFAETDPVDNPVSLYAATKRAGELLVESYHRLYQLPATGLRFFTVYGPYGRPDMAYFMFTRAIAAGEPITVFAGGKLKRDFTYIDDIVSGVLAAIRKPSPGHRIYNLGNNQPVEVNDLVTLIEKLLGRKAQIRFAPMQQGDVPATWADLSRSQSELGYQPSTALPLGMKHFFDWYKQMYGNNL